MSGVDLSPWPFFGEVAPQLMMRCFLRWAPLLALDRIHQTALPHPQEPNDFELQATEQDTSQSLEAPCCVPIPEADSVAPSVFELHQP